MQVDDEYRRTLPIKHGSHINAELPAVITSAKQHNAFTHQAENVYSFEINVNLVFFNVFSLAQLGGKAASNVKKKRDGNNRHGNSNTK